MTYLEHLEMAFINAKEEYEKFKKHLKMKWKLGYSLSPSDIVKVQELKDFMNEAEDSYKYYKNQVLLRR